MGLRRTLGEFSCSFDLNQLVVNYPKTKVMPFGVRPKIRLWSINNHNLEQIFELQISGGCGGLFKKFQWQRSLLAGKTSLRQVNKLTIATFTRKSPKRFYSSCLGGFTHALHWKLLGSFYWIQIPSSLFPLPHSLPQHVKSSVSDSRKHDGHRRRVPQSFTFHF